jgi:hypothetical protein
MQPCPVCGSANITIVISAQPRVYCSNCGACWIQEGSDQWAVQTREPSRAYTPELRAVS